MTKLRKTPTTTTTPTLGDRYVRSYAQELRDEFGGGLIFHVEMPNDTNPAPKYVKFVLTDTLTSRVLADASLKLDDLSLFAEQIVEMFGVSERTLRKMHAIDSKE